MATNSKGELSFEEKLNKIQQVYLDLEEANEKISSQKYENPKLLTITKVSGEGGYSIGFTEIGYSRGIEVGKCCYLEGKGGRWFRTSTVQDIGEETFTTCNSVYKYRWNEEVGEPLIVEEIEK